MHATDVACDVQANRPRICEEFPDTLPRPSKNAGYLGFVIRFEDGSCWKLVSALSDIAYQQNVAPFEARQVFTCVCLKDPQHNYDGIKEAVIKVKYQANRVESTADDVLRIPSSLLYLDVDPVYELNEHTKEEINALEHFRLSGCDSTPHLLDYTGDYVCPGVDKLGMVDGYVVFILMTKLPGEQLKYHTYWNLSLAERNEIRAAFKKAMLDVYRCNVYPLDSALRNIIWDKQQRKCYIIDFEYYSSNDDFSHHETPFCGYEYESWKLAEKCFLGWE